MYDTPMEFSPEVAALVLFVRSADHLHKFQSVLDVEFKFDNEIRAVYDVIKQYYGDFDHHTYIGKDELLGYITPKLSLRKDWSLIQGIILSMYDLQLSESLCYDIVLRHLVEKHQAHKIVEKALKIVTGNERDKLEDIEIDIEDFKSFKAKQELEKKPYLQASLADLAAKLSPISANGINWRLNTLQDALGPLIGDCLIHIVSRPEIGKTALLSSELTYFATQIQQSETLMWINNEESSERLLLRLYMAFFNKTRDELFSNIEQYSAQYNHHIGDKIKIFDNNTCNMTIEHVTRLCKEYKPRVLVIDHGDKLTSSGSKNMEQHVKLRDLYSKYRVIGKTNDIPVIVVGHLSQEAEGKKWITQDVLDCSKTGKAAEVDVILGIGATHNEDEEYMRYLSAPKNKLTGKHIKETVLIRTETGRYSDLA